MIDVPNPGSKEAIALGCLCPVLDNCGGAGFYMMSSTQLCFYINCICPIHGATPFDTPSDHIPISGNPKGTA